MGNVLARLSQIIMKKLYDYRRNCFAIVVGFNAKVAVQIGTQLHRDPALACLNLVCRVVVQVD